jgi:phage-related protein
MATFPNYEPTYPLTKKCEPKLRVVKFGDGYEQRIKLGLNQNPAEWPLTFILSNTDTKVIEDFLIARADDAASFDWVPPDDTIAYKWKCPSGWSKEIISPGFSRLSFTLVQVFEP